MTPQALRNSILQNAIEGKLVPQHESDGSAANLKSKLLAKKSEWVSAGIMLRKAETKPFLQNNDLFDIPSNWEWVQLSDVSIIQEGAGIRKWQYTDSGTQILCVTNILEGSINLSKKQLYISTEEYLEKYQHLTLNKGDIVTSCSGGSWGKIAFFDCDTTMMLNTSTLRMRFIDDLADNTYLYYVCKGPFFKRQLELQLSGMQPNFGYAHYSRILFPLPPLEEQKRIVAKLEEILPLIDRYEAAWNKLEEFNKRFPGDMQKSILHLAIQGKLVEQRPEEGTGEELFQQIQAEKQALINAGKIKKEKTLPEIAEDEIPFDVPESWKWVRLRSLGVFSSGKTPTMGIGENWDNGTVSWITSKDMKSKYLSTSAMLITEKAAAEMKLYTKNTILMVVRSGILKRILPVAILTRESTINQDIKALSLHMPAIAEYVYVILKGMETHILKEYRKQVTTVDSLRFEDFQNMPVPLPPLAEQKRIVSKLEEILPLCERLK